MSVWIIPAADSKAAENYPKTLSNQISNERLNQIRSFVNLPDIELYAWGFPENENWGHLFLLLQK